MATVSDLTGAFERIAPLGMAEPWDNVGLLLGAEDEELSGPVVLAIDLTSSVTDDALDREAGAVVAYHPPIFDPILKLGTQDRLGRNLLRLARAGISVYSPHTALDAAPGGVNDWLARGAGSGDVRALQVGSQPGPARVKIVTFVPADDVDQVRNALASAGAGRIGDYELCSFGSDGRGTFLAGPDTNPAVGERGHLESVEEVRLEMVCPAPSEAIAIETLREFHPYEEPAFDLYDLRPTPARGAGPGRRVVLDQTTTAGELAERFKEHLGIVRIKLAMPRGEETREIRRVGVCAGSGSSLNDTVVRSGCDLFVTGEMQHHEVLGLLRREVGVLLCGHTSTERGYLPELRDRLAEELPGLEVLVSPADRSPLRDV